MSITEDQLVVPTKNLDDTDIFEEPKFVPLTAHETEMIVFGDDENPVAEEIVDDITSIEKTYRLTAHEQAVILRRYTAYERLLVALPLISSRNPNVTLTHAEVGFIVSASREKVCRALKSVREKNPDIDVSCVNFAKGRP